MEEVPVPAPGTNEVLVKLEKTAICGTDLHIYKWDAWAQKTIPTPMVVGNEDDYSNFYMRRARLWWRPKPPGLLLGTVSTAGRVNSEPPGRSRLPVTMLMIWISHWQSVP